MTIFRDIGQYLLMLGGMISRPENAKMYWKEFIHQCSEIGVGSLAIVVIISIFMGAVSTTLIFERSLLLALYFFVHQQQRSGPY